MEKHHLTHFVFFISLVTLVPCLCLQDVLDNATTSVYVVTLKQAPTSHSYGVLTRLNDDNNNGFKDNGRTQFQKPRYDNVTKTDVRYGSYVTRVQDSLLKKVLKGEKYLKLYSYHYLINGFVVLVTQQQKYNYEEAWMVATLPSFSAGLTFPDFVSATFPLLQN